MATVDAIRQHGTGDERGWASQLLAACSFYARPFEKYLEDLHAARANPADAGSDEVTARQRQAYEVMRARCGGVNELDRKDRVGWLRQLRAEASADPGATGRLDAIGANASRGDTRWTPAEADSITAGLYGGDPAVARAAFWALYSSIDRNAPGGEDMNTALLFGMAPVYVNPPLSQFESLGLCAMAALCGTIGDRKDGPSPYSPAVLRLMDEYRAAFDAHLDARRILAIR
jgi:hypothetical protein